MSKDRFDELYERYSDGELSDVDRAQFISILETPQGRERFAEHAAYEAALSEELRVGAAARKTASSRTLPKSGSRRIALAIDAEPDELRLLKRIGAVAAAAVLAILTIVFAITTQSQPPRPLVSRPLPVPQLPDQRPLETSKSEPPPAPAAAPPRAPSAPGLPPPPDVPRTVEPPSAARLEAPSPAPVPPPPRVPLATPDAEKPRESATFVGTVEALGGEAKLGDQPAEAGRGVPAGQSLSTGRDGYLAVRYPDGSRLELAGDTLVAKLGDGPSGKSGYLDTGMIFVEAAKQPAGRPMVLTTAQAESTVIGTQFVLSASAGTTRLDVREGRVRFTRLPQAVSSVVVTAGHYAVAGGSGELVSRPGVALWKAPTAGLQLWLRADAGVKLSGSAVAAWVDQSATGNSAVQDKPAAQPLWVSNAQAGRPALRFDGANHFFQLPDGFSDFRLGLTVFVVARPAAGGTWSRFIDLDIGPTCDNIVFGRKDGSDRLGFWIYANSQTKGRVEAPGAVVADQVQSFSALLAPGGHVTLFRNGAAIGAGDTSAPRSIVRKPNLLLKSTSGGSESLFNGDLFEVLLYNRALSETERSFVEAYFYAKYFDPATPPASWDPTGK